MPSFSRCPDHPACVLVVDDDGQVTHRQGKERPGVAAPPLEFSTLTNAEAERLWSALKAVQGEIDRVSERVSGILNEVVTDIRHDFGQAFRDLRAEVIKMGQHREAVHSDDVADLRNRLEAVSAKADRTTGAVLPIELEDVRARFEAALDRVGNLLEREAERVDKLGDQIHALTYEVGVLTPQTEAGQIEQIRKELDEVKRIQGLHADRFNILNGAEDG